MPANEADFAGLFKEYYSRIYRYVRYRVDDEAGAEDLTAEIFERAYRYRDTYDPARGAFSTWITRIARNWVNNFLASESKRAHHEGASLDAVEHISASAESSPEVQLLNRETVERLLHCLERLTVRDREIIALRFGSNMRNKDIAELMTLNEHAVSVIIFRALGRLRSCQEET